MSDEEPDFEELPLVALPVIFILATFLLFSMGLHQESMSVFVSLFLVTIILSLAFILTIKKKLEEESVSNALRLAFTPVKDVTILGEFFSSSSGSSNSFDEKVPPAPQKLKNELFFERADRCCEYCGNEVDAPEVHHINPRSERGKNIRSNLIVLCPGCHTKADRGMISKSRLRYSVRNQN